MNHADVQKVKQLIERATHDVHAAIENLEELRSSREEQISQEEINQLCQAVANLGAEVMSVAIAVPRGPIPPIKPWPPNLERATQDVYVAIENLEERRSYREEQISQEEINQVYQAVANLGTEVMSVAIAVPSLEVRGPEPGQVPPTDPW